MMPYNQGTAVPYKKLIGLLKTSRHLFLQRVARKRGTGVMGGTENELGFIWQVHPFL